MLTEIFIVWSSTASAAIINNNSKEMRDFNLKELNRTIINFIWNTTERIKRNTVIEEIGEGGIGLIYLKSKL